MKTLVCIQPGNLEYSFAEELQLQKNHAIIKIKRIGVCGTDLHAYEGTQPFFEYPRILGHELAGELIAVDNAPGFTIGESVTIIPYFNCGNCIACRTGKPNCCSSLKVFGVHTDGGMMEYISIPSSYLVHGEDLSFDELALAEPLAIGAHAVKRAAILKDEFILIVGAGPIGLAAMEFANLAGAKVITMDTNEQRLAFCKQHSKAVYIINATSSNIKEQLTEITIGDMPSVVMDATGNLNAINNSFQYIAHGGRYVLIGLQKGDICFSHPEFHKREATLMSSRNATRKDFEQVIDCIKNKKINPCKFITHRILFDEVKDNFSSWLNAANGVIKAMIEM